MANIPTWSNRAVFSGKMSDLRALVDQASKPYPVIRWSEVWQNGNSIVTYSKNITWEKPKFAFWNFVHPSNEEIYKYFDQPNKRVYQRKWNREHWGSAYDVGWAEVYFVHKDEIQSWSTGHLSRDRWFLSNALADVPPDSTDYCLVARLETEDCPTAIWSLIAQAHPNLTATIRQAGEYGWKLKVVTMENGVSTLVASTEVPPRTHDEQATFYGACRCETNAAYPHYWPEECREKAEQAATSNAEAELRQRQQELDVRAAGVLAMLAEG